MNFADHREMVQELVDRIEYRDWEFRVVGNPSDYYLQIWFYDPDTGEHWSGRKWRLSKFMTESEVVGTCFKAALTCEEHECRERFKFMGRAVYGPHIDVFALHGVAAKLDERN